MKVWWKGGDYVFVLGPISATGTLDVLLESAIPSVERTTHGNQLMTMSTVWIITHHLVIPPLTWRTTPPPLTLLCQFISVHSDLPPFLSGFTFPSHSQTDDLMPETYTHKFDMLVLCLRSDLSRELDQGLYERVLGIIRRMAYPITSASD